MLITPIKTPKLRPHSISLTALLDTAITDIVEGSVLAITSKIVAICEGNVLDIAGQSKEELIESESQYFLPAGNSKYGHHFTITNNTLIPMSGIDVSNGDGQYILWPRDSQATANQVRKYLANRFGLQKVGVVITDSTSQPLRRGTSGIALAHSGFSAVNSYNGQDDLFGRPFAVTMANVSGGLAAAAVVAMGEGSEQTPLCVLSGLSLIEFLPRDPSAEELDVLQITLEDDLFAPFLQPAAWQHGKKWKDIS